MWGAPSSTPQRRPARLEQRGGPWACAPEARDTGCLLDSAENAKEHGVLCSVETLSLVPRGPRVGY